MLAAYAAAICDLRLLRAFFQGLPGVLTPRSACCVQQSSSGSTHGRPALQALQMSLLVSHQMQHFRLPKPDSDAIEAVVLDNLSKTWIHALSSQHGPKPRAR